MRIFSQRIQKKFGMENAQHGKKRHITKGMELLNQEKIRTLGEKETFRYLGILEDDTIKHVDMKEKRKKEYLMRTKRNQTR